MKKSPVDLLLVVSSFAAEVPSIVDAVREVLNYTTWDERKRGLLLNIQMGGYVD